MFLMNTSPLVALQRKWEPFGQARSCRYPVCFSESEDDIARTSLRTEVQMIINNLQCEEPSLGTTSAYGCILQGKRKGVKTRVQKLTGNRRWPPQGPAKCAQHSCPADSYDTKVKERSAFEPLSLSPDSDDDSVDREIEEAIQEYLKNKGQRILPLPSDARSLPSTTSGKSLRNKGPSCAVTCTVFPGSVKTGVIPQPCASDFLGDDALRWAPSPCSVSSDDSFEQSIKAEIEQFLTEKKEQARKKVLSGGNKSLDQKEAQEKETSLKSEVSKAGPSSLKRGGKSFFLRRHPEPQNTTSFHPQCWMPKAEQPVDVRKTGQMHLDGPGAGHAFLLEQSCCGELKQRFWEAGGEQGPDSVNVCDSSSDDGIEEAIQLYQLEKVRKAVNAQAGCVISRKEELGAGALASRSAGLTIHSETSALAEASGTPLGSRRKTISSKPTELNRISATCNKLGKGRPCSSPANHLAIDAVTSQTCKADTVAELMCAEAILDISKTILPTPLASGGRSLLTDPGFRSQCAPPSLQESDSNAVDSDDSIEQEIRAFLAIKAQTGHLATGSDEGSIPVPNPLSCGQLGDQVRDPKCSFPRRLKLSLDHKRQLEEERQDEHVARFKKGCSPLGYGHHPDPFASQKENVLRNVQNSGMGGAAGQQGVTPVALSPVGFVTPLSQGLLATGGLLEDARQALQKYSTEDKSSSLDSDEDLDTAIKDLLRSKRKLKKKTKDQKIQCKKKVRFGNAELHIFEDTLEVLQEKAHKSKNPTLLKSCLMRSRRNIRAENTQNGSQYIMKGRPKSAEAIQFALTFEKGSQPISRSDNQAAAIRDQNLLADMPVMEDSSSLDSDDSIEQEIQRFLAEKARDSSNTMEIAGFFEIVDTVQAAQLQTAQLKAKCQQLESGDSALSKPKKRTKKGHQPVTESRSPLKTEREGAENISQIGEQTIICREDIDSQATVKLQGNQGSVQATGAGLSVKRMGVDRKGVSDGKLVQRSLPSWKEKAENGKLRNYFKPMSRFRRKSPCEIKISSKFIAGFRSAQKKKKSVLLRKNQSINLSVPQGSVFKRQEGLLDERCKTPVQKGILGSKSQTGEADLCRRCMAAELYPLDPVSTGVVSLAKAKPFDDEEPCCHAESKQNCLLWEPTAEDARGIHVSSAPSEVPVMEKEGEVQGHSRGGVGLHPPSPSAVTRHGKRVCCGPTKVE